jgi:hypothetical protein
LRTDTADNPPVDHVARCYSVRTWERNKDATRIQVLQ